MLRYVRSWYTMRYASGCAIDACRRPHQSLAAVGVAALVRLIVAAGESMSTATWVEAITTLSSCAADTRPAVHELVAAVRTPRPSADSSGDGAVASGALPALPGTPMAGPALAPAGLTEDSPWDAKSPGDSPRASAITATRLDSTSSERRQVCPKSMHEATIQERTPLVNQFPLIHLCACGCIC